MLKKLYQLQSIVLLIGVGFAWFTVYQDFARFYGVEGTVFKIQDCILTNPVTTPCFWGAWAFLIAFIWSLFILKQTDLVRAKSEKKLTWLLIASVLFAWGNFGYVLYSFLTSTTGSTKGCSGVLTTNPFATPCFIGSVIFLIALALALVIKHKDRS